MSLATRLKTTRKKLGLSQTALADAVGVTQPTVAGWEAGGHAPRRDVLPRIAEALGTEAAWLLSGEMPAASNPAHRHLARPIRHLPIYEWPSAGEAAPHGQPVSFLSAAFDDPDGFGLRCPPGAHYPRGAILLFSPNAQRDGGDWLVAKDDGYAVEAHSAVDDVLARLLYSVVAH